VGQRAPVEDKVPKPASKSDTALFFETSAAALDKRPILSHFAHRVPRTMSRRDTPPLPPCQRVFAYLRPCLQLPSCVCLFARKPLLRAGVHKLMHPAGECATARACDEAGEERVPDLLCLCPRPTPPSKNNKHPFREKNRVFLVLQIVAPRATGFARSQLCV